MALAIRNLYLFDRIPDVRLEQTQEYAVQVRVGGTVGIIVGVRSMPLAAFVDVLHQKPRSGAAIVIDAGRLALMDDYEIFGRAVDFDFDNAANGFRAQFYVCHKFSPP